MERKSWIRKLKELIENLKNLNFEDIELMNAFRDERNRRLDYYAKENQLLMEEKTLTLHQLRNNIAILRGRGVPLEELELHMPFEQIKLLKEIFDNACREFVGVTYYGIPIIMNDDISRFVVMKSTIKRTEVQNGKRSKKSKTNKDEKNTAANRHGTKDSTRTA